MHHRHLGVIVVIGVSGILALSTAVHAQQFEVINSFAGCPQTGCGPAGDAAGSSRRLVLGPDGHFYGTSPVDQRPGEESPRGWGTVFRVTSDGTRTVLHYFPGSGPGGCGSSSLTFGADGRLYGVGERCGVTGTEAIYRLDGTAFEIIQEFPAGSDFRPISLIAGGHGAFYGLGQQGPASLQVVYKWDGATVTTVMTVPNAASRFSDLSVRGPDGSLYFTSYRREFLPVFESSASAIRLTPDGLFEHLYSWGNNMSASLTLLGDDGVLYGYARRHPDPFDQYDSGFTAMFRLTLDGLYTPLVVSSSYGLIGAGVDGSLYLADRLSGESGAIWRLMPDGTQFFVSGFSDTDGRGQASVLTRGRDGHYYGVTPQGGEHGLGVFFRLRMPGVDIKANGADGPVTVGAGDPLQLAMGYDASATEVLYESEVYLAVVTPALQIIWTTPSGFSLTPAPLYSGPLPSFPSTPLFDIPDAGVLPPGDYYWVAIVDDDSNGVPNGHYVDFVKTTKRSQLTVTRRNQ